MSVGTVVKELLARTDELGEAVFCFFIVQFFCRVLPCEVFAITYF